MSLSVVYLALFFWFFDSKISFEILKKHVTVNCKKKIKTDCIHIFLASLVAVATENKILEFIFNEYNVESRLHYCLILNFNLYASSIFISRKGKCCVHNAFKMYVCGVKMTIMTRIIFIETIKVMNSRRKFPFYNTQHKMFILNLAQMSLAFDFEIPILPNTCWNEPVFFFYCIYQWR